MVQAIDDEMGVLAAALIRVVRRLKHVHGDPLDTAALAVLFHVRQAEPLRVSDLAAACLLDLSTVSRHVRALEDAGFLTRQEDPSDRRASSLRITPKGVDILDQVGESRRAALGAATATWPTTDRQTLTRLLLRLASDLDSHAIPIDDRAGEPA